MTEEELSEVPRDSQIPTGLHKRICVSHKVLKELFLFLPVFVCVVFFGSSVIFIKKKMV